MLTAGRAYIPAWARALWAKRPRPLQSHIDYLTLKTVEQIDREIAAGDLQKLNREMSAAQTSEEKGRIILNLLQNYEVAMKQKPKSRGIIAEELRKGLSFLKGRAVRLARGPGKEDVTEAMVGEAEKAPIE